MKTIHISSMSSSKPIPSQAAGDCPLACVETMSPAPRVVGEDIVRPAWKHAEARRNDEPANRQVGPQVTECKAMLKEAGKRLGLTKPVKGKRPSLRGELHEAMYVDDEFIPLMRDGAPIEKPDGYDIRPIHVMTSQGPRDSIKSSAYCSPSNGQVAITFTVRILNRAVLGEEQLAELLAFGQDLALGADRSQDRGKYAVIGFEPVAKDE